MLIAVPVWLLISCNDGSVRKEPSPETITIHWQPAETIELDHDAKWKVADTMLTYIRNMETAVGRIDSGASTDYKVLSLQLKENIELLTSNCTMEGKAHDELHKWLVPFISFSEKLDSVETIKDKEMVVGELRESFKVFNTYFE